MGLGIILELSQCRQTWVQLRKKQSLLPSSDVWLLLFCVLHKTEEGGYINNKAEDFPEL